jgi:hypothetical protein
MTGDQVALEMDILVLGPMKWVVQEVDRNTFKANFQSKAEFNRMVEWGMVKTKDRLTKMIIEEGNGGSHYKQALRRVWVQMTSLPGELREYLTIWAIGTILDVMKDVDMKFTREFNRARFQVLVLGPNVIPHSIDVVIGEFIDELHFRVEREELAQPIPIDMDDDMMKEREDEGTGSANDLKLMQQDPSHRESTRNSSAASSDAGCKKNSAREECSLPHSDARGAAGI